ncbi:hypothetical protein BSKO_04697 [Bryopsis sp. KO-2023]|nr:hypothetical protein BSKO_04697 [Bryopsis sp. KO-2023]
MSSSRTSFRTQVYSSRYCFGCTHANSTPTSARSLYRSDPMRFLNVKIGLGQGGHPAPEGRFTYACSLRETGTRAHGCGGALVAKKWVLTAAHCVSGPGSVGATPIVYVGAHGINDKAGSEVIIVIPSVKVFVHEGWTGNGDDGNDIALLLLERESTKTPVRLPDASQQLGTSQIVAALGWGRISDKGPLPSTLQVADDLEYVENINCLNVWFQIKDNMMCAHATSQGTCQGKCDSGGPLVIPDEGGVPDFDLLVGLVSFGPDDCGGSEESRFKPGVYTRVSSFRQWIDEKMVGTKKVIIPFGLDLLHISKAICFCLKGSQTSSPEISPSNEAESPAENTDDAAELQFGEGICREDCDKLNVALYYAAGSGNLDKVKELLSKGADPSSTNGEWKFTPLHGAAQEGHVEIVEILIGKVCFRMPKLFQFQVDERTLRSMIIVAGADIDAQNDHGSTALAYAAQFGQLDAAKALVRAGANVNARNVAGETPFHYASFAGIPEFVQLLLDNGAEIDAQDYFGDTPVFWAAKSGSAEVIEVLKSSGADLSTIDNAGDKVEDEICRCLEAINPVLSGCREGTCGEGEIERLKALLND